jgi:hypothetical protein
VGPGDYVKTAPGRVERIASVYGVGEGGKLEKNYGVVTETGHRVGMMSALRYLKAGEAGTPEAQAGVAK